MGHLKKYFKKEKNLAEIVLPRLKSGFLYVF